jgi:hypothetical protein
MYALCCLPGLKRCKKKSNHSISQAPTTELPQTVPNVYFTMVPQNAEETTVRIVKRRGWNAFKDALNALNAVSDAFPLLKAPIGGLLFLLDKIDVSLAPAENSVLTLLPQKVSDKYDDWTAMATRIEALSTIIAKYQGDSNMRGRTDGVTEFVHVNRNHLTVLMSMKGH